MTYLERLINAPPVSWLFHQRLVRGAQLVGACIHATRSSVSDGDDGPRTENWMKNPNNGSAAQGWGGSCDVIIFEDGTRVIVNPNIETQDCTYGAGFGGSAFTWSVGWYYRQIEMAQGNIGDQYTFAQIDSLAEYLVNEGVSPVRIPFLTQTLGQTPPPGICTHEDSENGVRLGKSDPGPLFPWILLFGRMAFYAHPPTPIQEDDMYIQFEGNGTIFATNGARNDAIYDAALVPAGQLKVLAKTDPLYAKYAKLATTFAGGNPLV